MKRQTKNKKIIISIESIGIIIAAIAAIASMVSTIIIVYESKRFEKPYLMIDNKKNVEVVFKLDESEKNVIFPTYNYDESKYGLIPKNIFDYTDLFNLKIVNIGNSPAVNIKISHYDFITPSLDNGIFNYNDNGSLELRLLKKDFRITNFELFFTDKLNKELDFDFIIKNHKEYSYLSLDNNTVSYNIEWYDVKSIENLIHAYDNYHSKNESEKRKYDSFYYDYLIDAQKQIPVLMIPIKITYENIYGKEFQSIQIVVLNAYFCKRIEKNADNYFDVLCNINVIDYKQIHNYLNNTYYWPSIVF